MRLKVDVLLVPVGVEGGYRFRIMVFNLFSNDRCFVWVFADEAVDWLSVGDNWFSDKAAERNCFKLYLPRWWLLIAWGVDPYGSDISLWMPENKYVSTDSQSVP